MRLLGPGSLQNLHDRPGWITDAVLCRHGQAGSGVESGVLSSHVATDAFESEDHCQTAGIETGESGSCGRTRLRHPPKISRGKIALSEMAATLQRDKGHGSAKHESP